jgi:hypothetical protein
VHVSSSRLFRSTSSYCEQDFDSHSLPAALALCGTKHCCTTLLLLLLLLGAQVEIMMALEEKFEITLDEEGELPTCQTMYMHTHDTAAGLQQARHSSSRLSWQHSVGLIAETSVFTLLSQVGNI